MQRVLGAEVECGRNCTIPACLIPRLPPYGSLATRFCFCAKKPSTALDMDRVVRQISQTNPQHLPLDTAAISNKNCNRYKCSGTCVVLDKALPQRGAVVNLELALLSLSSVL